MSITLSSILHTGSSVSGTGTPLLSDSPVVTSKIDTTSTSFDLVNTTATTVNIAGAATSLSLAGNSGTTTIRNNLSVSGNITSTVATGTAPFVVTSATPVTGLNIGGYATKLKSSTGEVTVSSTTPSTGQVLMATGTSEATWQTISTGSTGTVTSVGGTGTVNGITLSGTVDTANPSGNLTLSGTLSGVDLASAVTGILPVTHGGTGSTTLTFPSGTADIGYLNIPQISQSSNYTCVLSDAGKHILHPSEDTTGRTFTIPANASVAYAIGTVLVFVNEHGAGPVTIAIDTDNLYLAGAGTTGTRTLAADGIATAIKTSTTNWLISGTNLS